MVKHFARRLLSCLSVITLVACATPTIPITPVPTMVATDAPPPTPTPTTQGEMGDADGVFVIGDVSFTAHKFSVESSESVAVAAELLDGDAYLDLVISNEPELAILYGDGAGGFDRISHMPGGEQPVDFALADLDEDGDIDIVAANHDTDYLTLLLGDGAGGFEPAPNSPLRIAVSPHPHAVLAVDFDGDGHVDLMVDHRDAEGLLVLKGRGDGSFESPGTVVEVGGDPYRGMAVGDLDGDGRLDVVTPNPGEVAVLLHAGSEQIAFTLVASAPADAPFGVGLGDFNGDGRLDLIAASDEGSPLVEIFVGDGAGGFEAASGSPIDFAPGGKSVAVGDFNNDGFDDAVVACWQSPEVLVILGGRDAHRTGFLPGGEHPWGLAAADLNGDGLDDLVIVDDGAPAARVYLSAGS